MTWIVSITIISFTFATGDRRGHSLKLHKNRFHVDIRKFVSSNRACEDWNSLPENIVRHCWHHGIFF